MGTVLRILVLLGAALAVVAAVRALSAYLRLRRARAALQDHLTDEVVRLGGRTGELEKSLSQLEVSAQRLPVQISELQQSLTTLQILTGALATSLRQAQKVLSYSALKGLSAARVADLLRVGPASRDDQGSG